MANKYIEKIKNFLYEKNILPLIVKEKHLHASTLEDITQSMKPVPYRQASQKYFNESSEIINVF